MSATNKNLFIKALNRLRKQLFGDDPMQLFEKTPETGETLMMTLAEDWSGRRVESAADAQDNGEGFWQFQIVAANDWKTSQAYMNRAVSFKIGGRRWKVNKVEKPVGKSWVWKIKAEVQ